MKSLFKNLKAALGLALFCLLVPSAATATPSAYQPTASIAALQAYGSVSASVLHANVQYYNTVGDLGGGDFDFVSGDQSTHVSADPQHCIWVPPSNDLTGASGAWERNLSSYQLNPDMCGGGTGGTDVLTQVQAAFTLCGAAASPSASLGINYSVLIPHRYKMYDASVGLLIPGDCTWGGLPIVQLQNNTKQSVLDFGLATYSGPSVTMGNSALGSSYTPSTKFGNVFILSSSSASAGLWITHLSSWTAENITVYGSGGPCIKVGFQLQGVFTHPNVSNCGQVGGGEFEVDNDGEAAATTTLTLIQPAFDSDASSTPSYCATFDRARNINIIGGVSETCGTVALWGIATKSEGTIYSQNITITGHDFEGLAAGELSLKAGTGWTGTAGSGVLGLLLNSNRASATSGGTTQIYVTNTSGFRAVDSYVAANAGQSAYDFEGTNYNAKIDLPPQVASTYTLVKVGGVASEFNGTTDWDLGGTVGTSSIKTNTTTTGPITLSVGVNRPIQNFTGALTGDLTVNFSTTNAVNGSVLGCINNTTGGHNVVCNGVTLAAAAIAKFSYTGSAWTRTQ